MPTTWVVSWPLPATTTTSPGRAAATAAPMAARRSRTASTERPGGHARQDVVDDGLRLLGARVVGGDDRAVGEPGGDLAHDRALGAVAVAAAAEDDREAPVVRRQLARRSQGLVEGVGLVGVVDQDGERLAGVDELEPPRHRRHAGEAQGDLGRRQAGHHGRGGRAEGVADVETAGERQGDGHPPPVELRAGRRQAQRAGVAERVAVQPHVAGGLDLAGQALAPGVVDADHRVAGVAEGEQARLGAEVRLHRPVVVEVVLGQVGEDPHGEPCGGHPVLVEPVRRHLHGDRVVAAPDVLGEQGLQLGRLGRRAGAGQGADDPAGPAGGREHRGEQVRQRRLARASRSRRARSGAGTGGPRTRRRPGPSPGARRR